MGTVMMITVGERIMLYRRRARITKSRLAEIIGVPVRTVTELEDGVRAPSEEEMKRIADVFGCSAEQMLYGI